MRIASLPPVRRRNICCGICDAVATARYGGLFCGRRKREVSPLDEPSVYAAWRAQYLRRLAGPVFPPLGGASVYPAWRAQYLSRLAGPVFIPLGGASIYPAWRTQCLSRLAGPVFIPLGGLSIYPAWRAQCLSRLADLVGTICISDITP